MDQTISLETSSVAASRGWYQSIILKALEPMASGYLRLELPDGSVRTYGQPGAEVSAAIRVVRKEFFQRCVFYGDIGLGEGYVDGDWETDDITKVIVWFILNANNCAVQSKSRPSLAVNLLNFANRVRHWLRPNSLRTSRRNISEHYDLGNEFYELWLDSSMTYSSALFSSPTQSLEEAQFAKYDALCRKLNIGPEDHVLEIGCGWGGFSVHAVKHYGCRVTAVTISQRQYDYAAARFQREGIAESVDLRLQDYRLIEGQFSKVVSIEMMEALGDRYLETYFRKINEVLTPDGLVGLQYITVADDRHETLRKGVDWIQKHIFPGSLLLSVGRVNEAVNATGNLSLHDLEDMGRSYQKTLHLWRDTFNEKRDRVLAMGFDERFCRKWNYYLCYCEAAFGMRNISVVQGVYTRPNNYEL